MATDRKFKDKKEYSRWYYQNYGKYGKKKGRNKSKYPLSFNNNNRPRLTEYYPNHPGMVSNDEAQRQVYNDRLRRQARKRQEANSIGRKVERTISSITRKAKKKGHKIYNRIRKLF